MRKLSLLMLASAFGAGILLASSPAAAPAAGFAAFAGQGGTWSINDRGEKTLIGQAQNNLTVNVSNNGPDDIEVVIGPPDKVTKVKKGQTAILQVKVGQSVKVRDANPGNGSGASGRYRAS